MPPFAATDVQNICELRYWKLARQKLDLARGLRRIDRAEENLEPLERIVVGHSPLSNAPAHAGKRQARERR